MVNNLLDLVFIDFMNVEPKQRCQEKKILVMTNAFLKFHVEAMMPNQQAKTLDKAPMDK